MPEEMKPHQNPDWLYTRSRKYARPLLYEPMERYKRSIPLAGNLATTSVSRYDRYQLPDNNLPKNPKYAATIAPNKMYVDNIQASITRSKEHTNAPLNERYLYNNRTETERKYYDGEQAQFATANDIVNESRYARSVLDGHVSEHIINQLPTTSRKASSHVPMQKQMNSVMTAK